MKKIVLRTLGGKGIGYGHYYRCLSLAKSFVRHAKDCQVIFIINETLVEEMEKTAFSYYVNQNFSDDIELIEDLNPDIMIIDTYEATDTYLKDMGLYTKVVLVDDNKDFYDTRLSEMVVNGNLYAEGLGYPADTKTKYLLGSKYLLMREEYWKSQRGDCFLKDEPDGILITTGGTDPNHISIKILEGLKDIRLTKKVVIGPAYDEQLIRELEGLKDDIQLIYQPVSLKEYISKAKYVMTSCGTTVYEVMAMGKVPYIYSMADNQDKNYEYLTALGVIGAGKYPELCFSSMRAHLFQRTGDEENHAKWQEWESRLIDELEIDGDGARRIVKKIMELLDLHG